MWQWIIWIFKMLSFSYLSVAFNLLTVPRVMRYYNSVYHIGFIVYAILFMIGKYLAINCKKPNNVSNLKVE